MVVDIVSHINEGIKTDCKYIAEVLSDLKWVLYHFYNSTESNVEIEKLFSILKRILSGYDISFYYYPSGVNYFLFFNFFDKCCFSTTISTFELIPIRCQEYWLRKKALAKGEEYELKKKYSSYSSRARTWEEEQRYRHLLEEEGEY